MKYFHNTILAVSLFLFLSIAFNVTPANAATTQIFEGQANQYSLDINNGKVVWSVWDGTTSQLYLYDINTGTTLQADAPYGINFTEMRDGKVVGKCGGENLPYYPNVGICIYDIATNETTVIDSHATTISPPHIEENKVVWITYDSDRGLYLYDISTNTTTRIADNVSGGSPHNDFPSINEGKVLFNCNNGMGLCIYDVASGNIMQIFDNYADYPSTPEQISNGKVVFSGYNQETGNHQIYLYDIATQTSTQISNSENNNYGYSFPRINNGYVVFVGYFESHTELYSYNVSNGTTTTLINNPDNIRSDDGFYFRDGKIVWGYYNNKVNIYDLASGTLTQFSDGYSNEDPVTSNGKVAWSHCDENSACEVLLWDPNAPEVSTITAPSTPVQKNTTITTSATFTNPNTSNLHTAVWDWGDGTTAACPPNITACTITESNGSGSVTGSHAYTDPGTYTITLTVTDNTGATGQSTYQFISVYDNQTDSISGSTRFVTPVGSVTEDPNVTGNTDFGFTAKYDANGNVVPDRNDWAQLVFDQGNTHVEFLATQYQSLTINGATAILKGTGNYNSQPGYSVLISAKEVQGGKGFIRYQIKDANNNVIYDTQPNAADTAEPTTPITKGKIKIN